MIFSVHLEAPELIKCKYCGARFCLISKGSKPTDDKANTAVTDAG